MASRAATSRPSSSGSSFRRPPPRVPSTRRAPRRSVSGILAPYVVSLAMVLPSPGLATGVAVGLDPLLADLLGDRLVLGHGLLVHAHPLLGHGPLLDDRLLLVEHDLVLLLGDLGAGQRLVDVRVGDRLALQPNLLAAHRDRLLDVLGHHVLAQPRAPALTLGGADPQ